MIRIDRALSPASLLPAIDELFAASAEKIRALEKRWNRSEGTPVFTREGRYTNAAWTEWTQGFQFGSAILQFDAASDEEFLEIGRSGTVDLMAPHVSHVGVHDHGFNNVSTYGNLLRLCREGRIAATPWEEDFYRLALKISGAVQASRWTQLSPGKGYVYSFNGPHSLFADTIRSMRSLAVSRRLGHKFMGERDREIPLLQRLVEHALTTAEFNVYFGENRDTWDIRGRTAHESIFNLNDGSYRCPSTQQGYSAFTTWTRGLAWILCGYPEQLEFFATLSDAELEPLGGRAAIESRFIETARAVADFYLEHTPTDGVPYWDTGAPGLANMGDYLDRPAEPFNDHEPVDSSAAVIGAQGLIRLGKYLTESGESEKGRDYFQAGLTVAKTCFSAPYLSTDANHEGLILHSIYHRPQGWDHVPDGQTIPCGESSMWGDYHARELALLIKRLARDEPYLTFFNLS